MRFQTVHQSKISVNFSRTVDHGLIENVHPFFAEAREEDGEEHAQEVMKFDEAINEYEGYEDPDEDPTNHHLDRPVQLSLDEKSIRQ